MALFEKQYIIFLLAVIVFVSNARIIKQRVLQINRFESCYVNPDRPWRVDRFQIIYVPSKGYVLDALGELYRDLKSDELDTSLTMIRCRSREALDTCEHFTTLRPPKSYCKFFEVAGMGIDKTINGFEPPLKCPFKKGIYKSKNETFFHPEMFNVFPVVGYYWKLSSNFSEGGVLLAILCGEGQIVEVPVKVD